MKSAEEILLPIQCAQHQHDLLAHRDILNLDTQTRIKHMTLHFLKYAGKIASAEKNDDTPALGAVITDVVIICLATANAMNVSLGAGLPTNASNLYELCALLGSKVPADKVFGKALFDLVTISGQMAKAIESTDHLEQGNPRVDLEQRIAELTCSMLAIAGALKLNLEVDILARWQAVESKSIFRRVPAVASVP